jgi:hydrogenase nickel incorporation protein HypA/HybF
MHEASLAQEVLNIIERAATAEGFTQVKAVEIEVGQLSCVEPEALHFAIDALAANTLLEAAEIVIRPVIGRLRCHHCEIEFNSTTLYTVCPHCQQSGARIVAGDDMQITEIEVLEVDHV